MTDKLTVIDEKKRILTPNAHYPSRASTVVMTVNKLNHQ